MPGVEESEIARSLAAALARIERRIKSQAQRDRAIDAVTDAILRAVEGYDPSRGAFAAYAAAFVERAILWALHSPLPRRDCCTPLSALPTFAPTARHATAEPFADLPPPLRLVCQLYHLHDYTLEEVGLLTGTGRDTVCRRLREAAQLLANEP